MFQILNLRDDELPFFLIDKNCWFDKIKDGLAIIANILA